MSTGYRYHRVSPSFWTDRKVLAWNDDTRLLAMYIMTCEHRTTEGLFRLPKAYICADMGWDEDTLSKPFAILLRDGFIEYDEDVSVMLLTNALKWNPTNNDKHAMGAVRGLAGLPETPLLKAFIRYAERYDKRLHKELVKRYGIQQALTQALSQTQEHPRACVCEESPGDQQPDAKKLDDDSDSNSWHEFDSLFFQAFGGVPNQTHYDEVGTFLDDGMDLDAVVEALRITALNKARNWSYTRRILQNWLKEKLYTLEQVKESGKRADSRASPSSKSEAPEGLRNAMRSAEAALQLMTREAEKDVAL